MKKKEHLVNMGVGDEARVATSRTYELRVIRAGIWGSMMGYGVIGIRGRIVEFVLLKGI